MPRIPVADQRQVLQVSNPTGFQNTAGARAEGEALADFGAAIAKTAAAVDTFMTERKKASRATDAESVGLDASLKAIELRKKLRSVDPEKRLEAFNEAFDKEMTPQIDSISDPETKARALNEYKRVKVSQLNGLFNETAKDSIDMGKLKNNENHVKYLELVRQDPTAARAAIMRSDQMLEESGILYDPVEKEAVKQQNRRDIVQGAINSYINKGQFNSAQKALTELAEFADEKQLTSLDQYINEARLQYDDRQEREAQREERKMAEMLEEQRTQRSMDYNLKMIKAASPEERNALMEQAMGDPMLSVTDLDSLQLRLDRKQRADQTGFAADLAGQILDAKGADLVRLGNSLKAAHKGDMISDDDYERLYRAWTNKTNEKNKVGPKAKRIYQDPEFKRQDSIAREQLDIAFPKPKGEFAGLFGADANQIRVDARNIYEDLVSRGARPRDAMERAINAVNPNPSSIPAIVGAEGINQDTEQGVDEALRLVKTKYESGDRTQERTSHYLEQLKRGAKKKKALRAQRIVEQMRMAPAAGGGGSTNVE